jgi:chromosomal replication initiator protein
MLNISVYAIPSIRQAGVEMKMNFPRHEVDKVIEAVCQHFRTSFKSINVRSRKRELLIPRQMIMYILSTQGMLSLVEIGRIFTPEYDHTTVIHSREQMRDLINTGLYEKDAMAIMNMITR